MLRRVRVRVLSTITRGEAVQALIIDDTGFPKKRSQPASVTWPRCGLYPESLKMRVQPFQLTAGIGGGELPIGLCVVLVSAGFPGSHFLGRGLLVGNTPIKALTRQDAEFGFSQIKPTAVLGSVVPLEPLHQSTGLWCGECLVEQRWFVGIEIVLNERDLLLSGKCLSDSSLRIWA